MMRFSFNEEKAVEALALIAEERPGFTPLFVSKVLFFAEKWHLNRYGRPIIADTYIAMPLGPVPSTVKNFIDGAWDWCDKPENFDDAVHVQRVEGRLRLLPGARKPNYSRLSESDMECLREAIAFCKDKTANELSWLTHQEQAWLAAEQNRPMDYEMFIDHDNPAREQILESARENAAYGVL